MQRGAVLTLRAAARYSAPMDEALARILASRRDLSDGLGAFRDTILRESGLDAALAGRVAAQVTWLLTAVGEPPAAADDRERAAFAYAGKFVRDPHGVTGDDVAALCVHLGVPQVVGLTELLALLDGFTRMRLVLEGGGA
jgi:alkylhydroperoxidase family enzyme